MSTNNPTPSGGAVSIVKGIRSTRSWGSAR